MLLYDRINELLYHSFVVLRMGSHLRAHEHLFVDMARRRSAADDVDARGVRSDVGGGCVEVTVGARVVDAAVDDAFACGRGEGRDAVVVVDRVACTNVRDTRVLVVSHGQ